MARGLYCYVVPDGVFHGAYSPGTLVVNPFLFLKVWHAYQHTLNNNYQAIAQPLKTTTATTTKQSPLTPTLTTRHPTPPSATQHPET